MPTELIDANALAENLQLKKLKLENLAPVIMKLLKLDRVNDVLQDSNTLKGGEFTASVLDKLGVAYEFDEEDLANIPRDEPFVLIANHPYGGIDGLILLSLITKVRPEFKLMANYLLGQIEPVQNQLVSVNPFEKVSKQGMNMLGIKRSLSLLNDGVPVGIFPAGEVSAL